MSFVQYSFAQPSTRVINGRTIRLIEDVERIGQPKFYTIFWCKDFRRRF